MSRIEPPSMSPARCDDRQHHANEYDQGGNLNPDEAAEFSQNDFDTIAPWRRQRVADSFDAARCGSQRPFDPIRPVVKSNSDENPRQDSGDDPETVHLRVMPEPRIVPLAIDNLRHATVLELLGAGTVHGARRGEGDHWSVVIPNRALAWLVAACRRQLSVGRDRFDCGEGNRVDLNRQRWRGRSRFPKLDFLADAGDRIAHFPDHALKIVGCDSQSPRPDADLRWVGQVDLVAGWQRLGSAHRALLGRVIMAAARDLFRDSQNKVVSASYGESGTYG